MPVAAQLIGRTFGKLTVVSSAGSRNHERRWNCVCECGGTNNVSSANLLHGYVKSCGCVKRGLLGRLTRKHGMSHGGSQAYRAWSHIKSRCLNPRVPEFSRYGGRGIKVCEEWLSFENFYRDMGDPPSGMTIERIDVNGNYCKENCRWATWAEQAINKRRTFWVEYEGRRWCLRELCRELKLHYQLIWSRMRRGESFEQAKSRPSRTPGRLSGIPV